MVAVGVVVLLLLARLWSSAAVVALVALAYSVRTYRLSRRGQATDRFTKALEKLSSADLYVRLGAVYALEQLTRDSPALQTDIAHVLIEFIRARTPPAVPASVRSDKGKADAASTQPGLPREPDADIQRALNILDRLPRPTESLNFSNLHLARVDIRGAKLAGALLDGANLSHAQIVGADLTEAALDKANLSRALVDGADLTRASLDKAKLMRGLLRGANLTQADLRGANLTGARLNDANLTHAHLEGANLYGARLKGANLTGARLWGAHITAAQVNSASSYEGAVLPSGLIRDPRSGRVRDATEEEFSAAELDYRGEHGM